MTPTEATRIAKWLQVLLIILQAIGTAVKAIPMIMYRGWKIARRR